MSPLVKALLFIQYRLPDYEHENMGDNHIRDSHKVVNTHVEWSKGGAIDSGVHRIRPSVETLKEQPAHINLFLLIAPTFSSFFFSSSSYTPIIKHNHL